MTRNPGYYWRLVATGGCFATFGVGGLLLSTFVFPVLMLMPTRSRSMRARRIIHRSFKLFMGLMQVTGIMRFEVTGAERLRTCRNTLVLANHPTLIDVVALVSLMPTASCVVKKALWDNPFLRGVVRATDYISNSEPEKLIEDCSADLAAGNALIIFPEGTRSQPGKPLRFLRGAAYIALRSKGPVLPVLIDCKPMTLTKRDRWYQIPHQRFHLRVVVLDPVDTARWVAETDQPAIAARKLTFGLEELFKHELRVFDA